MSLVHLEKSAGVATLTLARPAMHNALVPELLDDLLAALAEAGSDPQVGALVLAARGPAFSIGGDMRRFLAEIEEGRVRTYSDRLVGLLNQAVLALVDLPKPVVAAIHGHVTGGSLGLLLGADLAVMAEEAVLKAHYATAGFCPDGGWTACLPEILGGKRAAAALYLNRSIRAKEALEWGLVNDLASAAEVPRIALSWAQKIAAAPEATIDAGKRLLRRDRQALAERLEAERRRFVETIVGADAQDGVRRFLRDFSQYPAPQGDQ